jgi:hypothetical protein
MLRQGHPMIRSVTRPLRLLLLLTIGLVLHLHAATAKDIQGEWTVDANATWDAMKSSPQFAGIPPEQQGAVKAMFAQQMSQMIFSVTADTITTTMGEKKEESTYKVLGIEGDKISTESTDAKGKVEKTDITLKGDSIVLTNVSQPGMMMVLKRKAAK